MGGGAEVGHNGLGSNIAIVNGVVATAKDKDRRNRMAAPGWPQLDHGSRIAATARERFLYAIARPWWLQQARRGRLLWAIRSLAVAAIRARWGGGVHWQAPVLQVLVPPQGEVSGRLVW